MTSDTSATHLSSDAQLSSGALASAVGPTLARVLPATALLCALLAVWIVQHPAYGLIHDSQIYLIQALARLDPASFSQDIFLRYGSQDQFTVFGPLFAAAMRVFGVENANVVFTLVAQVGFFAAAVVLARMLIPTRLVWLSIALVCALPGFYGGGNIFALVEDFATPRLLAEAFVVAGLAAFLSQRFWLAAAFGLIGMAIHPLMTAGGVVVALCTSTTPPRVRAWALAGGVVIGGALLAWAGMQGTQLRFDDAWLQLLRSGLTYLWVSQWTLVTWSPTLVSISTLVVGVIVLERSHARSLCRAGLITAAAGILLTYVAGDLLLFVRAVQVQPYRWLWVSTLIAYLLTPLIAHRLWSRAAFGRPAVLLLVAAWLCMSEPYGIGIAALAIAAAMAAMRIATPLPPRTQRLILFGASAVLALAVVYHVATILLYTVIPDVSVVPWILRDIRALSRSGVLPYAVFVLVYFAVRRFSSSGQRLCTTAGCIVLLAVLAPSSVHEWSTRWYDRDYDVFAEWRALIPPRTEVLWFDSPISAWLLLQRPSYLSNLQEASGVFSRPAAMAMKHRVNMLESYLATERTATWRDKKQERDILERSADPVPLGALCAAAPDLRFIVTTKNMLAQPLAAPPPGASFRYRTYRLYRCDPARG